MLMVIVATKMALHFRTRSILSSRVASACPVQDQLVKMKSPMKTQEWQDERLEQTEQEAMRKRKACIEEHDLQKVMSWRGKGSDEGRVRDRRSLPLRHGPCVMPTIKVCDSNIIAPYLPMCKGMSRKL
jgi:hypothetical protein